MKTNGTMFHPDHYFAELRQAIDRLPTAGIAALVEVLFAAHTAGKAVYLFGNGGSAALASHHACDLAKGTIFNGSGGLRAFALTDNVPLLTAWGNDSAYDDIFAGPLRSFMQEGDVAFAISGSGNSPNVIRGLERARSLGGRAVGLTGMGGGRMRALCEVCVVVPSDNMQIIEDVHVSIAHCITTAIRTRFAAQATAEEKIAVANTR